MTTTEDTLKALRTRISTATTQSARAQVEHDNAIREREAALAALAEFGVSTPEQASAKLQELEAALTAEIEAVEAALAEAEA